MVELQKPLRRDDPIILRWARETGHYRRDERASGFFELWMGGETFEQIGCGSDLSGTRVSQIVQKIALQALWLERRGIARDAALGPRSWIIFLELSTRTVNALEGEVYPATLEGLSRKTEAELLRIPNFGRKSLKEVKAVLASVGLSLAEPWVEPVREPFEPRGPTSAETRKFREGRKAREARLAQWARGKIDEDHNVESVALQSMLLQWRDAEQSGVEDELDLARAARDEILKRWGF